MASNPNDPMAEPAADAPAATVVPESAPVFEGGNPGEHVANDPSAGFEDVRDSDASTQFPPEEPVEPEPEPEEETSPDEPVDDDETPPAATE